MPICKEVVLTIWKQMFIPSPLYCGRSYPGRHPMCSQGEGTISSIMLVSWTALLTNMVLFMLTQTDPIICCSFYVVKEHGRPDIDPCWPDDIQSMLESSFDVDIGMRPVSSWFTIYDIWFLLLSISHAYNICIYPFFSLIHKTGNETFLQWYPWSAGILAWRRKKWIGWFMDLPSALSCERW